MVRHSPYTQDFSYMISELNDHHNMHEEYSNENEEYIRFKVWFGNLKNELRTNVDMQGNVHYGGLKCVLDKSIELSTVQSVIPESTEVNDIFDDSDNPVLHITVHSTDTAEPLNGQEYIKIVTELKTRLQESDEFSHI